MAVSSGMHTHEPLLELSSLTVAFGERVALRDVSARVDACGIVTLVGANAAGKTTLLRTIAGMQRPQAGSIGFARHGRRIDAIPAVAEAQLPRAISPRQALHLYAEAMGGASIRSALEYLSAVDAAGYLDVPISACSMGTRQKLCVALALVSDAFVLLLDETLNGLDLSSEHRTLDVLRRNARESGQAVLLATHNIDLAQHHSDQVWLLHEGRLVGAWGPENLQELAARGRPLSGIMLELIDRMTALPPQAERSPASTLRPCPAVTLAGQPDPLLTR